jgi:SET domain-containing protein 6
MLAAAKWEWDEYLAPVRAALGELSFDAFLAARSVVTSRAFSVDPRHGNGLVPFADLFNHHTGACPPTRPLLRGPPPRQRARALR